MLDKKAFTCALSEWFRDFGRHDLPWRTDFDPYRVWVSEIMLQQTQVPRVASTFYPRFLELFPTVESLAKATWEEVYPAWKGLGFYGRGRRMIECAKVVVEEYNSIFPQDPKALKALPGIGNYTAHAVLAFAYDWTIPAIDTNIEQLLKYLFPGKDLIPFAQELVKEYGSGREWNGAMMDLMSAVRRGDNFTGKMGEIITDNDVESMKPKRKKPVKKTKKVTKGKRKFLLDVGIGCIYDGQKYLIQQRKAGASHALKWEFPGGKREKGEDLRGCVKREILEELGVEVSVRPHFHEEIIEYERIDMRLRFHRCRIQKGEPKSAEGQTILWVAPEDLPNVNFIDTSLPAVEKLLKMKG